MWSLPSIASLNERAVNEHKKRKGRAPGLRGKTCEYCDQKAEYRFAYHDLFGDAAIREIPKGYLFLCEGHYDRGTHYENFFECDSCGKLHVLNYTWEIYRSIDNDGNTLCLPCAFKAYIEDPENWITKVPKKIDLAYLKHIPHAIAVESTYWEEDLIFIGNAEFDSSTGEQISGDSLTSIIEKALGHASARDLIGGLAQAPRCIVLLDAGWQFAVSFGVYLRREYAVLEKGVA